MRRQRGRWAGIVCGVLGVAMALPAAATPYFDAVQCRRAAERSQITKVSVGTGTVPVAVAPRYDAEAFRGCMVRQGHLPTADAAEAYLRRASDCLARARGSAEADAAFEGCMAPVSVEVAPGAELP